ncbi:hypothetical protein [Couchioplanes caeruleus]|uniref:DUF3052 family protein n=2 Tax=Couchioplanes caeruleus TaxID=56438 RepID=A0A1K0FCR6_9ACTN|nr:hypothetical protein [Couchioplanes caeruleus]OJF10639.1 hypothetical protein BG844_30955 [Couchioplanes caeruleus subsp. caeruleus]ROP30366.1 hypothetical protein EDD30_3209 [Couchioplanes caeruleus]
MTTIAEKLLIRPHSTVWLSHPAHLPLLTPMPEGVREVDTPSTASAAVIFADDTASVRKLVAEHAEELRQPAAFWVAYPKSNKTDIDRDTLGPLVAEFHMQASDQVSIDDRWLALRVRADKGGESRLTGEEE